MTPIMRPTYQPLQCVCNLRLRLNLEESMFRHSEDKEVTFVRVIFGQRRLVLVISLD